MRYKLSISISLIILSLGVGYFFWQKSAKHFVEYASEDGEFHVVWQNEIKGNKDRDLFYSGIVNDLFSGLPYKTVAHDSKALIEGSVGKDQFKKLLKEAGVGELENYTLPDKIYFTLEKERDGLGFRVYYNNVTQAPLEAAWLWQTSQAKIDKKRLGGPDDREVNFSLASLPPAAFALLANFPLLDDLGGVSDIWLLIKQIVPKNNVQIIYSSKPIDPDSFNLKDFKYSITTLAPNSNRDKLTELEKQISTVLGKKFPLKRRKILPDKTEVEEIISNPEKFQWQKDGTVSFLEAREYGFKLAYILLGNTLVFGNDLEEVRRLKETFSSGAASFLDQNSRLLYLNNKKINWPQDYLRRPSGLLIRWFKDQVGGRIYFDKL